MSKLRDEEKARKSQAKEDELVLQIGKEGKEGRKNFKEYQKEEEEKFKEVEASILEEADKKRKGKLDYNTFMSRVLISNLQDIDWPSDWAYQVAPTEVGVVMEIKTPDKRYFRAAFKTTGDGYIDLNAVTNYTIRAENTISRYNDRVIVPK